MSVSLVTEPPNTAAPPPPPAPTTSAPQPPPPPAAPVDTGLPALALIANFHKLACDVDQVRHEMGLGTKLCTSVDIVRAAKLVKLKARRLLKQPAKALVGVPLPAML